MRILPVCGDVHVYAEDPHADGGHPLPGSSQTGEEADPADAGKETIRKGIINHIKHNKPR